MRIAKHLLTDPQHHGAMPLDQERESRFGKLALAQREPLEKLSVRQTGERPILKEGSYGYRPNS